jgi:rod shape-determining protein MreD
MLLFLTFVFGIVLTLIPLSGFWEWFRPNWLMLTLIFWMRALPRSIGFLVAWLCGFGLDSIQGTVIGQYPLVFLVVALLVSLTRNHSNYFSYVQQLIWVAVIVGVSQLLSMLISVMASGVTCPLWYLSSFFASVLAWPFVDAVMRKCHQFGWDTRLQSVQY